MTKEQLLKRYADGERGFPYARLAGVDLRHADLTGANFSNANLKGTNLSGAILTDCSFRGADLAGARFWGATLGFVSFRDAELEGAEGLIVEGPLTSGRMAYIVMGHPVPYIQAAAYWGPLEEIVAKASDPCLFFSGGLYFDRDDFVWIEKKYKKQ